MHDGAEPLTSSKVQNNKVLAELYYHLNLAGTKFCGPFYSASVGRRVKDRTCQAVTTLSFFVLSQQLKSHRIFEGMPLADSQFPMISV